MVAVFRNTDARVLQNLQSLWKQLLLSTQPLAKSVMSNKDQFTNCVISIKHGLVVLFNFHDQQFLPTIATKQA